MTNLPCPVCIIEERNIDGYDLITVLGLMKEYNWKEIWRKYQTKDNSSEAVSMYYQAENYFLELHIQKMHRIILSEKFNTNPFFMQQVIQRITASHHHDLILRKIRQQGLDGGENPICLSCSMGNIIVDLIVNLNESIPKLAKSKRGTSRIENLENRPLDVYDLSSALYLCQQNLTESLFRRYAVPDDKQTDSDKRVRISTELGRYEVVLSFKCIDTNREMVVPPPGNASVATIHQVIQRMNFRHAPRLIHQELEAVGLSVTLEEVETGFSLRRFINNTALRVDFLPHD